MSSYGSTCESKLNLCNPFCFFDFNTKLVLMENTPSLILSIPRDANLIEYFDTLDCFDKRDLINEFKMLLNLEQEAIRRSSGYFIASLLFGALSLCFHYNPWYLLILFAVNTPLMYLIYRSYNYANKLKWIVRYLEYRLV